MEITETVDIGDVEVDCPYPDCLKGQIIDTEDGLAVHREPCRCCDGTGKVTVHIGEREVTIEIDLSDYAPEPDEGRD